MHRAHYRRCPLKLPQPPAHEFRARYAAQPVVDHTRLLVTCMQCSQHLCEISMHRSHVRSGNAVCHCYTVAHSALFIS